MREATPDVILGEKRLSQHSHPDLHAPRRPGPTLLLAGERDGPEAIGVPAALVLDQVTLSEGLGVDGWAGTLVRALAQRFRDLEQQVRASGLRRQ